MNTTTTNQQTAITNNSIMDVFQKRHMSYQETKDILLQTLFHNHEKIHSDVQIGVYRKLKGQRVLEIPNKLHCLPCTNQLRGYNYTTVSNKHYIVDNNDIVVSGVTLPHVLSEVKDESFQAKLKDICSKKEPSQKVEVWFNLETQSWFAKLLETSI